MKRFRLSLILISLLFLTSLLGLFSIKSLGANTLDFTFERDFLYSETSETQVYDTPYNIRNSTVYTGIYNATYTFSNLVNGTSGTNIPYFNLSDSLVEVIDEHNGHNKVLRIQGESAGDKWFTHYVGSSIYSGDIELWWAQTNPALNYNYIMIGTSTSHCFLVRMTTSSLLVASNQALGGGTIIQGVNPDTWYHLRFKFVINITDNTDAQVEVWVNGLYKGKFGSWGTLSSVNKIYFGSTNQAEVWYDGIGFNWSNYIIGDNFIPLLEVNTFIQEVDKWEFTYSDFPTLYAINSDVFSDWDEIDTGDDVNIANDYSNIYPTNYDDRKIYIDHNTPDTTNLGIERDFNVNSGIINVSWSFNYTYNEGVVCQNEFTTKVYSYDDTLISHIYSEGTNLEYKDKGGSAVVLNGDIVVGETYDLNLYINYWDNISVLVFFIDGVYENNYIIPILANDKDGLGKIEIYNAYDIARAVDIYLDNVGVYVNGSSLSTEVAYRLLNLDVELFHSYWYFSQHGFFDVNATGEISFHVTDWYYFVDKATEMALLSPLDDLDGYRRFVIYEVTLDSESFVYSPLIWMEFYNQSQFNSLSIEGVQMTENGNYYPLAFSYGNIDINENYFWVDSSNRLQFKLNVNDSNLEYIQAIFNIDDIYSENRSISFNSNINGESKGFFSLDYTDSTNNLFEFPYYTTNTRVILPQTKKIETFTILITDNDLHDSDICTGYIHDISLEYNPDIAITISTLNLIGILTPLIILFVPPLALHKKFGVMGVVVMFLLMSLICVVASLIPVWLFFIIAFGSIGFLVVKNEKGIDS